MSKALSYRSDIDGLRALAVIPVVLFHLGLPLRGGFVGVDVFFVISGYLITSIIASDLATGQFSLALFYERRILRILPALFTVLTVATALAFFHLLPEDFIYFGEVLSATTGFASNILFWMKAGYFEPDSNYVPLLHTWSLAVEEQFYIIFPLLLMAFAAKPGFWRKAAVLTLCVISFTVSCLLLAKFSSFVFYNLPTRAWELLAGSILALGYVPALKNTKVMNALSLCGIVFIAAAVLLFKSNMPFPGYSAALPVLGAALIIYTGREGTYLGQRLLSLKPAIFFGKISYSLYLWHWPVIVFFKYAAPWKLNMAWMGVLFFVCVGLSYLSWRFIEQPARTQQSLRGKKLFLVTAVACGIFIALGLMIARSNGLPERFDKNVRELADIEPLPTLPEIDIKQAAGYKAILGDEKDRESFILWGDSHAAATRDGFDRLARENHIKGYNLGYRACMPSVQDISSMEDRCQEISRGTMQFLSEHPDIKTIVLVARWSAYVDLLERSHKKGKEPHDKPFEFYLGALIDTFKAQGKKVVIVTEAPVAPEQKIRLYLIRQMRFGDPSKLFIPLEEHLKQQAQVDAALMSLKKTHDFKLIDISKTMCQDGRCAMMGDGETYYKDDDHLSVYGSLHFRKMYQPAFE